MVFVRIFFAQPQLPSTRMATSANTKQFLEKLLEEGDKVVDSLREQTFIDCLAPNEPPAPLLRSDGKLNKQVSDVFDEHDNQYVNLVQQGGGVLGIALLGYTYVLERVGIRFAKLAGTSAGAINSSMLACIRPESAETLKSPIVLYYLASKNLFDLVDGHPIARTLIRNLIKTRQENEPDYATKLGNSIKFLLMASLPLLLLSSLLLWQSPNGILSLFFWLAAALIISFGLYLSGQLANYTPPPAHKAVVGEPPKVTSSFVPTLVFFGGASSLLGLAYLMACLAADHLHQRDHQLTAEFGPIIILFVWSTWHIFNKSYYWLFQVGYSVILLVILTLGISNRIFGVTLMGNPLKSIPPPYTFLSVTGVSLLLFFLLFVGSVVVFLYIRFQNSHFGINPGRNFRNWIAELMKDGSVDETLTVNGRSVHLFNSPNDVTTLDQFNEYFDSLKKRQLRYDPRPDDPIQLDDTNGKVISNLLTYDKEHPAIAIITAEIGTQNKIIFPRMTPLFWESDADVIPADFVRASMSLPVFFEPFTINGIPKRGNGVRPDYWKTFLDYSGNLPENAVFQDGGILSNFPVNVFFNASLEAPRLPTFGVRLDDADEPSSRKYTSIFELIWSVFNTARYYYDKDFLITNRHYQLCIGNVDVRRFNWIDFNMPDEEKIKLFRQGALAAATFLTEFDWSEYKKRRAAFLGEAPKKGDPFGMFR